MDLQRRTRLGGPRERLFNENFRLMPDGCVKSDNAACWNRGLRSFGAAPLSAETLGAPAALSGPQSTPELVRSRGTLVNDRGMKCRRLPVITHAATGEFCVGEETRVDLSTDLRRPFVRLRTVVTLAIFPVRRAAAGNTIWFLASLAKVAQR